MTENHKILKIFEKEFKNFTAFNINVNREGEQVWLNGYLGKENRAWKEGDRVDVEVWYDEKGERWRYKPAEPASNQNQQKQRKQGPPPQGGSGVPNSPDGVSNKELKHLIIKTANYLVQINDKIDALAAKSQPQENTETGPYSNPAPTKPEGKGNSGPQAPWDTVDDDLPF